VLGQGLDVGRLQVVVSVLDDAPAEFTQRFLELSLELERARRRNGPAAKVLDEVAQSLHSGLDDFGQIGGCGVGLAIVRRCGRLGQEDSCHREQQVHRVRHMASFRWCWVSLQLPKGETPPFSRCPGIAGRFHRRRRKIRGFRRSREIAPLQGAPPDSL